MTVYEATNKVLAEGNVVFDQGDQQRITGSSAEWNYRTKTGYFLNSTGFTNQTQDGTRMYFTADRVDKISLDTIVATNVQITACDEDVPKWSFHAKRVKIKTGDRVRLYSPNLRIKRVPIFYLPYASVSIKDARSRLRISDAHLRRFGQKRISAFQRLLPNAGTLGRRNRSQRHLFTRGIGVWRRLAHARQLAFVSSTSDFIQLKIESLGHKADADHPDQGGSSFYVEGVHYFPNGFIAAADVNVTSNLAYRQVFSDSIQQAISPEERSQVFVNKDLNEYSFNFLARSQVTSLPNSTANTRIRIRELPELRN